VWADHLVPVELKNETGESYSAVNGRRAVKCLRERKKRSAKLNSGFDHGERREQQQPLSSQQNASNTEMHSASLWIEKTIRWFEFLVRGLSCSAFGVH